MIDPNDNELPGVEEDEVRTDDIALNPGANADAPAFVEKYISKDVRKLYDVFSYRHAAAILKSSFPDDLAELESSLMQFRLTQKDIGMPGGNESIIPKKFSEILRPLGWKETRIQGDFLIRLISSSKKMRTLTPAQMLKYSRVESKELL